MLAKLENGNLKIANSKKVEHDGLITVNPTETDLINLGYKEVIFNRLEDKEGFYQSPIYSEDENNIIVNYEYIEMPEEVNE